MALISKELIQALLTREKEDSFPAGASPVIKALLAQPEEAPVDLSGFTQAEINALSQGAGGMWADHPDIDDAVDWVRDLRSGLL